MACNDGLTNNNERPNDAGADHVTLEEVCAHLMVRLLHIQVLEGEGDGVHVFCPHSLVALDFDAVVH